MIILSSLPIAALLSAVTAVPTPLGAGENHDPFCNDGGTFIVPCQGTTTTITVTSDAQDPDGDPLSYQWFSCPGSWLTDPTSPITDVVVDTSSSCSRTCGVRLRLTDPYGGFYVCRLYVGVVPGSEGCTPGYWKNHAASWGDTGFSPTDDFDTVFGVDAFNPNITLMQALWLGGGGKTKLARMGVAALLNSSDGALHGDVHFPLSLGEVVQQVHDAYVSKAYEPLATQLDAFNNLGCPQN